MNENSETFYVIYQIFWFSSFTFTFIEIVKEIHEVKVLYKEYLFDTYNYPTIAALILRLMFLFKDRSFFQYGYDHY